MEQLQVNFLKDIEHIQALEIVPSILELICRTTGMGFSAIARVTGERWIACAVKDEIGFGLKPGEELELHTTICSEIRSHRKPVVIDEVDLDERFSDHHTPKIYGFQSYISVPILLKDGTFFGTLCAIDPKPNFLKVSNMVTMFQLYADLISFHLQSQDTNEDNKIRLEIAETKLEESLDDIRQYAHLSRHTLREPLRKLHMFSDMIVNDKSLPADHKARTYASKIKGLSNDFSSMIDLLTDFSETNASEKNFQVTDLNIVLESVLHRLELKILEKKATIDREVLHTITGIPQQLNQLFYYILDNALNFTKPDTPPVITIYSRDMKEEELKEFRRQAIHSQYCKICIRDNGIGIDKEFRERIFDLFARLNPKEKFVGLGMGLSQSKKIIRNHEGAILIDSEPGAGSLFSLVFPIK